MAEDYSSPNFNSYNNSATQYDECSLYCKNIPASLSEDAFIALMSENGRHVKRTKLYPPRPGCDSTAGLVSFVSSRDADQVITTMNNKPPLNMLINFALSRKKDTPYKDMTRDPNSTTTHSQNSASSSQSSKPIGLIPHPVITGMGRGNIQDRIKFPSLKVTLEGDKRVAYQVPKEVQVQNSIETPPSDLPKLVDNPFLTCLACDNIGKFSCSTCKKPYCSPKCQFQDWPKHKLSCQSNIVAQKKSKDVVNSMHKTSRDSSYVSESSSSDSERKSMAQSSGRSMPIKSSSNPAMKQIKDKNSIKVSDIENCKLSLTNLVPVCLCHIESPSKFWVHLQTAANILSEMEKNMALSVDKTTVRCEVNDMCCVFQHGKFKRANVLQVNSNQTSSVQLMDFGVIETFQNNALFPLPEKFKSIPFQAICCKLVDTSETKDVIWTEEDTVSFRLYTADTFYAARTLRCVNNIFEVNLLNEDSISLYSIISGENNLESFGIQDSMNSSKPSIPSVLSNLKAGSKVNILQPEFEENKLWGILVDGEDALKHVKQLDEDLTSLNTKEVNMYVEEGDTVAGFSKTYSQFFRCVVLKRLRESFLVHYIDYGNKEEVTKLCDLTPELLKKCCYVVCCEKPDSLPLEDFKTIFSRMTPASVNIADASAVRLSISYKGLPLLIKCYPWYHGVVDGKVPQKSPQPTPVKTLSPQALRAPSRTNSRQEVIKSTTEGRITGDLIGELTVDSASKHNVKVAFMVNVSKIFVQIVQKEKDLYLLCENLNKYCSSLNIGSYSPIRNEVVCCKFKADGNWYRGQVIEKRKDMYKVFFIDFGNEDVISECEMKRLPDKFTSSKFSICVSLHNVKNEDLSEEIISKLTTECWNMEVLNSSASPIEVMLSQKNKSLTDLISKKLSNTKTALTFQKLPPGKSEVTVCHSDNEKVYVQQMKDAKAITDMCDKINATSKLPLVEKVLVDNLYCGLFKDGLWYRVCVTKELTPNTCKVTYVDFGNEDDIELKSLRELPEEFMAFPVFAIRVLPVNLKISQLPQQVAIPVEVTDDKFGIQYIKVLNVQQEVQCDRSSFKSSPLKDGNNEVIICYYEADVYYCQMVDDVVKYAGMSEELQSCAKEKPAPEVLSIGRVFCVKSDDGCWYRATIVDKCKDAYKVSFIDFGNTETVPTDNVMCLPAEFIKYPIFCNSVKISNSEKYQKHLVLNTPLLVRKIGSLTDGIQFVEVILPAQSTQNISCLKKQLLPLDEVSEISLCFNSEDIFYVQRVCDTSQIKSLEDKLLCAAEYETISNLPEVGAVICAKFSDGLWYRGSVEEVCNDSNSCKICFIDYGNSECISLNNMKILPLEMSSLPVYSIPVKFKDFDKLQEQVQTGATTFSVRAIHLSEDGVQLVDVAVPEKISVITSIDSQLLTDLPTEVKACYEEGGTFYVQKVSDLEKLKDMMIDLQTPANLKPLLHTPKKGEFVCVKFADQIWYRAVIKEDCGNDAFKVFFIDFGNTDNVSQKDICLLSLSHASLPMFGIPVKLSEANRQVTRLSVDECYTVKRIGSSVGNVQVIKVRPVCKPVLLSSIKSSTLEDGMSSVCFQSFTDNFVYLSKSSDCSSIKDLNTLLTDFDGEEVFEAPAVGEVLIVKASDKKWHRGCIQAFNQGDGHIQVFLIDLGMTENIPVSCMCYISEQLSAFAIFSIKAVLNSSESLSKDLSLGKYYNVDVISNSNSVPTVQIIRPYMLDSLKRQQLPLQQPKNVIFFHIEKPIHFLQKVEDLLLIAELQIKVQACSSGRCVNYNPVVGELLLAQSSDGDWYRGCVEEVISCDSYKIQFIDYGNCEVVFKEKLRCFDDKLVEYPTFCIAVIPISSSKLELETEYTVSAENLPQCNEPQKVQLILKSELLKAPLEPNQADSLNAQTAVLPNEQTLQTDSTEKYFITNCKYVPFLPGQQDIIYFVVEASANDEVCTFCAPLNEENLNATLTLTAEMTKYCNDLHVSSYNGGGTPEVGEMVLAKFEGEWYRAVVVDDKDAPLYSVLFVDFGNSDMVTLEALRKMEQNFLKLELQTHMCRFIGFHFEKENLPSILNELKSFVSKPLNAVVSITEDDNDIYIKEINEHLKNMKLVTLL